MNGQAKDRLGHFYTRKGCRLCSGTHLTKILDFGNVPLAGGFLKERDFNEERYYPLDLSLCMDCYLLQVTNVVPADVLYKNYFYFSSSIGTLVEHCAQFAKETMERFMPGLNQPLVFEIGCNDGVLLKPFAALGARAVGVDPAVNVVNSITTRDIVVINDYFNEQLAERVRNQYGSCDAIVSSYSFAHIDDMISVMKGVKALLKESGVFIFEVYYLGTLIDEMQYDMIYHEHMSYYSLQSLVSFMTTFDMEIFDITFTPGVRSGAVRFYAKHIGKRNEKPTASFHDMMKYEKEKKFDRVETFLSYADSVRGTREELLKVLDHLKKRQKIIIGYGASGRGTTIMNYCGIDRSYLEYVVDDAPAKHGFYTPGTHVPIYPWEHTKGEPFPEYSLLFAWSFIDEVKKRRSDYLKQGGKFIVPLPKVRIVGL